MTTKEQAEQDYMAGMKYKDIAAKYDVTINTVKSWKTRGKWVREKGAHKSKKSAHKNEPVERVQEVVEEPETDDYGLTPKERRLADEYIATGNKMQSAITAGYSESYARTKAHVLLEKARIKQYINDCLNSMSKPKIMDAQEVLELYTSIARGELTETVVTGSLHGQDITEKEADLRTRMAAGKEIMKRYPANDVLTAAKVRKLEAEADIAEVKAKSMEDGSVSMETKIVIGEYADDE